MRTHDVRLRGEVQRDDGGGLEPDIAHNGLSGLLHYALEARARHQQLRRVLVATDLLQSQSAWPKPLFLVGVLVAVAAAAVLAGSTLERRGAGGTRCDELRW